MSYGDPTQNVIVLQSPLVNLAGHNGTYLIEVTVRYVTGPIPFHYGVYEETATMTLTMSNLVLVDSRAEPYFVWKPLEVASSPEPLNVPEDPIAVGPTVPFSVQIQHAQSGLCTLRLEIFSSDNNQTPVLVKEFTNVPRPGVWQWEWDGRLADGSTAPRGIYLYRLSAEARVPTLPDRDSNRSAFLQALRAVDENNEPMLYAEYWGYDDKQTPEDETDDEHLYFIRWYVLKDSLNTNAHSGQILLFNPDLTPLYSWDITALRCLEHGEATDGLRADTTGIKHGVIVPVPVSVMQLGGEYRFLLQFNDDHVAHEKAHRLKPAMELNSRTRGQWLHIWRDSFTDPDIMTAVNWSDVYAAFAKIAGLPTRIHTEAPNGPRVSRYFGVPHGSVSFTSLSRPQQERSDKRTVITFRHFGGLVRHPGQTQEGRLTPKDPAVSWVNTNAIFHYKPPDGSEQWGHVNGFIHEITHVAMDDDTHCSSTNAPCIWRGEIGPYFYMRWTNYLTFVKPDGRRWFGLSPWHSLSEINAMRQSLGLELYRP